MYPRYRRSPYMRKMRFVPIDAFNMSMNVGMQHSPQMMMRKTSSPKKIPISMNKPMSLSPTGKECIQFPYGTSVITTINNMQGVSIPSATIYKSCY